MPESPKQKKQMSYSAIGLSTPYSVPWSSKDRPVHVQQRIDENFTKYTLPTAFSYLFTGQDDYYKNFPDLPSAQKIVEKLFKKKLSLEILDLGTGSGTFLTSLKTKYGNQVQVLGISAIDYRKFDERTGLERKKPIPIPDEEYAIGNIENLDQLPSLQGRSFDVIFCSFTMMHLYDPICFLCQSYELLNPKAIFITDGFIPNGVSIDQLSKSLKKYKAKVIQDTGLIPSRFILRIKKTVPHLELPIAYKPDDQSPGSAITYTPGNK